MSFDVSSFSPTYHGKAQVDLPAIIAQQQADKKAQMATEEEEVPDISIWQKSSQGVILAPPKRNSDAKNNNLGENQSAEKRADSEDSLCDIPSQFLAETPRESQNLLEH